MSHKELNLLYTSYQPALLRYAQLRCGEEATAKDIVHQVFLNLLEKEEPLQVQNWKAYLFTMARNETISYLRKEKLHLRLLSDYGNRKLYSTSHDHLLEKEYRNTLQAAVQKLPSQQRLVYELRMEYNWDYKKVAEMLDLSLSTVRKHIQYARKNLLQRMVA